MISIFSIFAPIQVGCVRWIATINGETRVGLTFVARTPDLDPSSVLKFKIGGAEKSFEVKTNKPVSFVFSGERSDAWNQISVSGMLQPSVEISRRYRFWGKLKIQNFHLVSNQKETFDLNPKTKVEIFGVTDLHLESDQTVDLGPDDAVIGVTLNGAFGFELKKVGNQQSFGVATYKDKTVSLFKIKSISKLNQFGEYFTFRQVLRDEKFEIESVNTIDCDPFETKQKLTDPGLVPIEYNPPKALKTLGL